ncbi:hypothetical protein NQZ68_025301 [Dissostichus eleginoides]|nr:hypothetical protein NQZ68_025301 [Dissostichus eleginoides]
MPRLWKEAQAVLSERRQRQGRDRVEEKREAVLSLESGAREGGEKEGKAQEEEEEEQEEMLTASEAILRVPARGDSGGSSGRGKDTEPQ